MGKLVKASGEVTDVGPPAGAAYMTLEQMQAYVGGYIEVVRTADPRIILVMNEDGGIMDPPLPPNPVASRMFREAGGPPWHHVRGDVLVLADEEMES